MTNTPPGGGPPPTSLPPIDDDMLNAYVDCRLDAASRARVAAWLEANPDEAARIADWQAAGEALRAAFDPVAAEPVPAALAVAASVSARPRGSWLRQAAAAVALLALGGAAGFGAGEWLRTAPREHAALDAVHLAGNAAVAHRVFAVEVRHPVEVGADQQAHLVQWLSRRLGTRLVAPQLEAQGYRLVGGRLLSAGEGPAAQLMYENREGKRITAFVANGVADGQTAFQFRQQGDVATFYWVDNGTGYALSGDLSRDALLEISRVVYSQLQP
ncbi:MAG: anti-sigma factor [Reyranellaceae bacterium]